MGKEGELWDDSALVKAFDDAMSKYKVQIIIIIISILIFLIKFINLSLVLIFLLFIYLRVFFRIYQKMHGKNKTNVEEKVTSSGEAIGSAHENQNHEPRRSVYYCYYYYYFNL